MTSGMDYTRYLNNLPDSHWKAWYDYERQMNAEIDRLIATGLHWEEATDQAYKNLHPTR